MEAALGRMKFGAVVALFCAALAVLVWFAPITLSSETRKIALATGFVNSAVMPVVAMTGKIPAIVALAVVALLGLYASYGPGLPKLAAPSRPGRATREEVEAEVADTLPPVRKRGLGNLTTNEPPEEPDEEVPTDLGAPTEAQLAFAERLEAEASLVDEMAAEWERQATPHGIRIDPVAIVRKRREKDRDWSNDRSHLGGLPRLADAEWPRNAEGVPEPFIAQLDLAEIAEANPDTPLPKTGSLAFFIGEGPVIYVPEGDHPPTPAPEGLPHAVCETSYPLPEKASPVTHQLFPFWPVDALRLRMPDDLPEISEEEDNLEAITAAQDRALDEMVAPREYSYSPYTPRKEGLAEVDTLWWYGADLVLRQLRASLDHLPDAIATREKWIAQAQQYQARLAAEDEDKSAEIAQSKSGEDRYRAQISKIEQEAKGLAEVIHHFEQFVAGREPWEVMGAEEVQVLEDVMRKVRDDFEDLCRYNVSFGIDDIRSACIRRMITGDAEAVAAIPDTLLDYINENYRRPTDSPNLMFGLGGCKQTARYEHLCDHLLLQIPYDDMPEMRFGDMGLFQWWISPEALAEGDFSKVEMTFECA